MLNIENLFLFMLIIRFLFLLWLFWIFLALLQLQWNFCCFLFSFLMSMGAYNSAQDALSLKVISLYPNRGSKGHLSKLLHFDPTTGELLAVSFTWNEHVILSWKYICFMVLFGISEKQAKSLSICIKYSCLFFYRLWKEKWSPLIELQLLLL